MSSDWIEGQRKIAVGYTVPCTLYPVGPIDGTVTVQVDVEWVDD